MGRLFDQHEEDEPKSRTPVPFVHEENDALTLHFEVSAVQSKMRISAPDNFLALGYTRTMMGFLLLHSHPRHIGMIGLGGGSIPKYCYRFLPHTKISVAEINPEVIALRDRFCIPGDDSRFKVYCEDGADFVDRHTNEFDVLIVDGFDLEQPRQLCSPRFYDDCYRALTSSGLMVVNLCEDVDLLASRICRSFHYQVKLVDGEDGDNKIVFAAKGNLLTRSADEWRKSVEYTKHHHPIQLHRIAADLQQERGICIAS